MLVDRRFLFLLCWTLVNELTAYFLFTFLSMAFTHNALHREWETHTIFLCYNNSYNNTKDKCFMDEDVYLWQILWFSWLFPIFPDFEHYSWFFPEFHVKLLITPDFQLFTHKKLCWNSVNLEEWSLNNCLIVFCWCTRLLLLHSNGDLINVTSCWQL